MSISVETARIIRSRRRDAENVVFERLWENLDAQIRIAAGPKDDMVYRVPMYKFGLPRYDPVKVAKRMRVRLRNRGFKVSGDEDTPTMRISWKRPKKKKKEPPIRKRSATTPALAALSSMRRQVEINKSLGYD